MEIFDFYHALRLYTIGYQCFHNDVATLKGILAAEDGINRSAPTHSEIESQLQVLNSGGLIAQSDSGYLVTSSGKDIYDQVTADHGTVFDQLRKMVRILNVQVELPNSKVDLQVNEREFIDAYDSYYRGT